MLLLKLNGVIDNVHHEIIRASLLVGLFYKLSTQLGGQGITYRGKDSDHGTRKLGGRGKAFQKHPGITAGCSRAQQNPGRLCHGLVECGPGSDSGSFKNAGGAGRGQCGTGSVREIRRSQKDQVKSREFCQDRCEQETDPTAR